VVAEELAGPTEDDRGVMVPAAETPPLEVIEAQLAFPFPIIRARARRGPDRRRGRHVGPLAFAALGAKAPPLSTGAALSIRRCGSLIPESGFGAR
jgi:hypothetical protein